jgi:hypothetical protein
MNAVRIVLAALAIGAAAMATPATARADTTGFVDFLDRHGEHTSGSTAEEIDLGEAICNMYSVSHDNGAVADTLMKRHSPDSAAVWQVASVMYLCPQYNYLLGH